MSKRFIDVAAGLLLTPDDHVLLAQRPGDKPWAGWWELPGGKLEPGETAAQALSRELHEEIGITVTSATPWVTYTHDYPTTTVRLAFHRVRGWTGTPQGLEGQALAWTPIHSTPAVAPLLPATLPPLRWLRLPDQYLLTSIGSADQLPSFLTRLERALDRGVRLVQFREPAWASQAAQHDAIHDAFLRVLQRCHQYNAACLINSVHPQSWWKHADGVHYRRTDASQLAATGQPGFRHDASRYVAMSAHSADDLHISRHLQADFAVLGHVLDTPSHAGTPGMGWDTFAEINATAGLPIFAIGGQSLQTAPVAHQHGAHGIAAIRGFLD